MGKNSQAHAVGLKDSGEAGLFTSDPVGPLAKRLDARLEWNSDLPSCFEASVRLNDWRIQVRLRPDIRFKIPDDEDLSQLLYTLLCHENGHWRLCPFDGRYHLQIRAAIEQAWATISKKYRIPRPERQSAQLCGMATNIFADLIVDKVTCRADHTYKVGMEVILELLQKEIANELADNDIAGILLELRLCFLLDRKLPENEAKLSQADCARILNPLRGDILERSEWQTKAAEFSEALFETLMQMSMPAGLNDDDIQEAVARQTSPSAISRRLEEDEHYREKILKEIADEELEKL